MLPKLSPALVSKGYRESGVTTRGMLIGRPIAILCVMARKITAGDTKER